MKRVIKYRGGVYIISNEPLYDRDMFLFVLHLKSGEYVISNPYHGKLRAKMCKLHWEYEAFGGYGVKRMYLI
jgi:hypothetical protein